MHFYARNQGYEVPGALTAGCIVYVIVLIYAILIYVLRKKIPLAIELIREASKAIGDVSSTLFFPAIPLTVQLLLAVFGVAAFPCLIIKVNGGGKSSDYEFFLILTSTYKRVG